MLERDMAERNRILEIRTGSHLYGLNTATSDVDYGGVFMSDREFVLGFKTCEEVDLSIVDKLESGKNSKDAVDRKLYDFRKFVKLAMENNPNVLEFLFTPESNIVFINDIGRRLLDARHLFPHKGLRERFIGYAVAQKKKMIIKRDNFLDLEKAVEFLSRVEPKLLLPQLIDYEDFKPLFKYTNLTDEHYRVGDMVISKNQTAKRAIQEIEKRIGVKTNRKELIRDKGYDYKFGSHLIRLLIEGSELLRTGELQFPLIRRETILDIKAGNWTLPQVLDYAERLENEINSSRELSKLPSKPRYAEIERFVIKEMEAWLLDSRKM